MNLKCNKDVKKNKISCRCVIKRKMKEAVFLYELRVNEKYFILCLAIN